MLPQTGSLLSRGSLALELHPSHFPLIASEEEEDEEREDKEEGREEKTTKLHPLPLFEQARLPGRVSPGNITITVLNMGGVPGRCVCSNSLKLWAALGLRTMEQRAVFRCKVPPSTDTHQIALLFLLPWWTGGDFIMNLHLETALSEVAEFLSVQAFRIYDNLRDELSRGFGDLTAWCLGHRKGLRLLVLYTAIALCGSQPTGSDALSWQGLCCSPGPLWLSLAFPEPRLWLDQPFLVVLSIIAGRPSATIMELRGPRSVSYRPWKVHGIPRTRTVRSQAEKERGPGVCLCQDPRVGVQG